MKLTSILKILRTNCPYFEIIGTISNPHIMLLTSLFDKYITFYNGDKLYV